MCVSKYVTICVTIVYILCDIKSNKMIDTVVQIFNTLFSTSILAIQKNSKSMQFCMHGEDWKCFSLYDIPMIENRIMYISYVNCWMVHVQQQQKTPNRQQDNFICGFWFRFYFKREKETKNKSTQYNELLFTTQ